MSAKISCNLRGRLSLCFGDEKNHKNATNQSTASVDPKRTREPDSVLESGKALGDEEGGAPVDHGRDARRDAAKLDGEQLAHHEPDDWAECEGEADDEGDARDGGKPV